MSNGHTTSEQRTHGRRWFGLRKTDTEPDILPPDLQRVYCIRCESTYVVKIGYPMTAPHGPNKDCTAQDWRVLA